MKFMDYKKTAFLLGAVALVSQITFADESSDPSDPPGNASVVVSRYEEYKKFLNNKFEECLNQLKADSHFSEASLEELQNICREQVFSLRLELIESKLFSTKKQQWLAARVRGSTCRPSPPSTHQFSKISLPLKCKQFTSDYINNALKKQNSKIYPRYEGDLTTAQGTSIAELSHEGSLEQICLKYSAQKPGKRTSTTITLALAIPADMPAESAEDNPCKIFQEEFHYSPRTFKSLPPELQEFLLNEQRASKLFRRSASLESVHQTLEKSVKRAPEIKPESHQ